MEQLLDQIRTWRRHLHAIPEIGFQEYKTSKYLYEELEKMDEYIFNQFEKLIEEIRNTNLYFVFVTNEIGMGVVPANKLSRIYANTAGKINQYVASNSDDVYLVISGIPVKIK